MNCPALQVEGGMLSPDISYLQMPSQGGTDLSRGLSVDELLDARRINTCIFGVGFFVTNCPWDGDGVKNGS